MVFFPFGAVGQIIGVDSDAMSPDQTGLKREKIPFCARSRQHVAGIKTKRMKDLRELVHKSNVNISLRVLDNLGGFSNSDRGRLIDTGGDDGAIDIGNDPECLGILRGYHLLDRLEPVFPIPRIDTLRRISDVEVDTRFEAGGTLEDRYAFLFGRTRVYGRLVDDDVSLLQGTAHRSGCVQQRLKVRLVRAIDRCWNRNNKKV